MSDPQRVSLAEVRAGRRPQPSQRAKQKLATRKRLLEAARETFIADGYAATTIDAITERASTSRATFYLHFAGKLDVLQELSADLFERVGHYYDRLDEILAARDREAFRVWIRDAVGWYEAHGRLTAVGAEAALIEPEFRVDRYELRRALARRMTRYMARFPAPRKAAAEQRIAFLIATIDELFRGWAVDGQLELEPGIDVLVDIWFPALASSDPDEEAP